MTDAITLSHREIDLLVFTGPYPFVVNHPGKVHWPEHDTDAVIAALHEAGAGQVPSGIRIILKLQGEIE